MAFCTNCGQELPEGKSFCANCGLPITQSDISTEQKINNQSIQQNKNEIEAKKKQFGPVLGIVALFFALIGFFGDPPALTVIVSIISIILAIVALAKNGKLKGVSIAAVMISTASLVITFFSSVYKLDSSDVTYSDVEYDGIIFSMPSLYDLNESNDGQLICTTENEKSVLIFTSTDTKISETQFKTVSDENNSKIDEMIAGFMEDYRCEGMRSTTVDGLPCIERLYSGMINGRDGCGIISVIDNITSDKVVIVLQLCTDSVKDSSIGVYTNLMISAKLSDENKAYVSAVGNTGDNSKDSASADGVNPELREFLDSYEKFVDKYVDFMKKYINDSSNVTKMLTEYTEIMEEYADFIEKVDAYDTETMSAADASYYIEVTSRCTQKMLEIN